MFYGLGEFWESEPVDCLCNQHTVSRQIKERPAIPRGQQGSRHSERGGTEMLLSKKQNQWETPRETWARIGMALVVALSLLIGLGGRNAALAHDGEGEA